MSKRLAGNGGPERGFSLPEVLAALGLIGVLLGLGGYMMTTGGTRAFAAAAEVAKQLEFARSRAIYEENDFVVTFQVADGTFTVLDDNNSDGDLDTAVGETVRTFRVAELGREVAFGYADASQSLTGATISAAVTLPGSPPKVTFTPRGTANDGTIYLIPREDVGQSCADRMHAVTVSAATARVRRWRYNAAGSGPAPWRPEL